MLPASVEVVVVVVVNTAYLVGDGFGVVVVDGSALVRGADVFVDDGRDYGVGG